MSVIDQILAMAQQLADLRPTFFTKKGPGEGDDDTNAYMRELGAAVEKATGKNYAEKCICGDNNLRVDFFVEEEATVVEIALSLRNPNCEFERDVLKAIMAQEEGRPVNRLVFISKPGGVKRTRQPSSQAIIRWAASKHGLEIIVHDLKPVPAASDLPL